MERNEIIAHLGITDDELTRLEAVEEQGRALASGIAGFALADMQAADAGTLQRNGDHGEQAMALWHTSSPEVQASAVTFLAYIAAQSKHTGEAVQ